MLCLSGFELCSRWVSLRSFNLIFFKVTGVGRTSCKKRGVFSAAMRSLHLRTRRI